MLSFASSPGNLMNRIGSLGGLVANVRTHQLAQLTAMTDTTTGVVAEYNAESDLQALMGNSYIGVLSGVEGVCTIAQNIAQQTLNRMVFRSDPRISQTLQGVNLNASMQYLIQQMGVAGASVLAMTVSATPSAFTGTGNGVIVGTVRRPQDGRTQENAYAESIQVLCNQDSYTGGATAGNEGFILTGTGQQTDFYAFNWPLGSNAQIQANAIDGDSDATNGNLLTNSGFNSWDGTTTGVPDNWVLDVGTAGTSIAEETTITYDGVAALRLTGNGTTLVEWSQEFGSGSGTPLTLNPVTQYAFNVFVRRDAVAAAAGVLSIELVDENGTVLLDAGSTPNAFAIDLTALTTVYTSFTGVFQTPIIMPATTYLQFRLTTALTNGRSVYIDKAALGLTNKMYQSGPSLSIFAGSVPFVAGTFGTCAIANSRGAGGTLNSFQVLFARFFSSLMYSNEYLLLSSNVPTISDGLIQ